MFRLLIIVAVVSIILAMASAKDKKIEEERRKLWVLELFQPSNSNKASSDSSSKSLRGSTKEETKPVILEKDDPMFKKV